MEVGPTSAEPTALERLDAIDAQMAGGALTREQAAAARLAVVKDVQATDRRRFASFRSRSERLMARCSLRCLGLRR
jgi:hypothetical protein